MPRFPRLPRWPAPRALLGLLFLAAFTGCGPQTPEPPAPGPAPAPAPAPAATPAAAPSAAPATPAPASAAAPAAPTATPAAPTTPAAAADLVRVAAGTFTMGDKEEVDAPFHEVAMTGFLMDRTLVTQEHYQRVMGENPSRWKAEKNPVEQVRWSDAVRFCNRRSELEGLQPCYDLKTWQCNFEAGGYRLPTEAEWEYACRAGTTTAYFHGDTAAKLGNHAWFDKNAGGRPRPVGQKQPNAWGLLDMTGNVWQWCNDFYKVDYYPTAPKQDPRGPATGENKVVRGGAWRFGAETCKSGYRYNESPGYSDVCFGYDIYGFRCVRRLPPAAP